MSLRFLQTLGFLLLIGILVAVAAIAHRQAVSMTQRLALVMSIQVPVLNYVEDAQKQILESDQRFTLYLSQGKVKESEIRQLLTRQLSVAKHLDRLTGGEARQLVEVVKQLSANVLDMLLERPSVSDRRSELALEQQVETLLYRVRNQLATLFRMPGLGEGREDLEGALIEFGNLITTAEVRLRRFASEISISVEDLTGPLVGALANFEATRQLLERAAGLVSDEDGKHDHLRAQVDSSIRTLKRLNAAFRLYMEEDSRMDPSASHVENVRKIADALRAETLTLIAELATDYKVHIDRERAVLLREAERNRKVFLRLAALAVVLFIVIMLVLSRAILRPIHSLVDGSERLANGQLDHRIGRQGSSEFVRVATAFNDMAEVLEQKDRTLQSNLAELDEANQAISEANLQLENRIRERTEELEQAMLLAQRANQAKSEFLANMSHELRTPMHAVLSFAQLGMKRVDTVDRSKIKDYLVKIHTGGERLLNLLNDLLDLSKLESGHMTLETGENDLAAVIAIAAGEFRSLLQEKSLNLDTSAADVDATARFDPEKILQVMRNLLSNAIKFSPEKTTITIVLSDATLPAGRRASDVGEVDALAVAVCDQGDGIPEGELEAVFDKFIQSSKTKTGAGGTGLGLAICKEIIDGHAGEIRAENHPQGGACFTFVLPR